MIQLYSKETQVYLALADGGAVVGVTDPHHQNSELVGQCERAVCFK